MTIRPQEREPRAVLVLDRRRGRPMVGVDEFVPLAVLRPRSHHAPPRAFGFQRQPPNY